MSPPARSPVTEGCVVDGLRPAQSALDLARRPGRVTVAEDIGTLEGRRLVQSRGCHGGQGWPIARSTPATDLLCWRTTHRRRLPELRAARPEPDDPR